MIEFAIGGFLVGLVAGALIKLYQAALK